jgi:hypothetical protein
MSHSTEGQRTLWPKEKNDKGTNNYLQNTTDKAVSDPFIGIIKLIEKNTMHMLNSVY